MWGNQRMVGMQSDSGLEHKFCRMDDGLSVTEGTRIEGYASLFGDADRGGDVVARGAFETSLKRMAAEGRRVRMLWQHDPAQPIGVWDEAREDARGLWVKGRLLDGVARAREAAALIEAGALDGLSIGYRTVRAVKMEKGERLGQRLLTELELWEVSLVTFPMLPSARVGAKGDTPEHDPALRDVAAIFEVARQELARQDD